MKKLEVSAGGSRVPATGRPQRGSWQPGVGPQLAVCSGGRAVRGRQGRGSLPGLGLPRPVGKSLSRDWRAHLLVLAQRLLLAGQARLLLLVRLVRGGHLVGLWPRLAAHLAARSRGLVDEGAARALPAHLGQRAVSRVAGQAGPAGGTGRPLTGGGSGTASGCWPGSWGAPDLGGSGSRGPLGCSVRSLNPRSVEEEGGWILTVRGSTPEPARHPTFRLSPPGTCLRPCPARWASWLPQGSGPYPTHDAPDGPPDAPKEPQGPL